jgi:hypothetical protein
MTVYGHPPPPDEYPDPAEPRDDPFLERLFATMCDHIYELKGETFVDQVRRWTETLGFMAALKPRTEHEWLLASDVAMKHLFALHSLALGRGKGVRMKQRLKYGRDFIAHARTMHAAQQHYDLIRAKPAG